MTPPTGVRPPTLVSGVGYHDLRDFSVGPWLARTLREEAWPEGVSVENLSYNPVAVVHRLQEEEPPFRCWIVGGAARRGRRPGEVTAYRWDHGLPDDEEVQARVAEAVTGVVGLDNLLVVTEALEAAPERVVVVEVEPGVEELGRSFTPAVREGAEEALDRIRGMVRGEVEPATLPRAPLGGDGSGNGAGDGPESAVRRGGEESGARRRPGSAGVDPADRER